MAVAILASYLIGAVPVGVLIGRTRGIDIRRLGSGNVGASNVMRVLGVKLGLLAFAADVLKGALPVLLGQHAFRLAGWPLAFCAAAAVVGHCYSPYLRFGGGKAVATGLGVLLALNWPAGLICFGLWALVVALTRYISLASMIAYAVAPLAAGAFRADRPAIVALVFLTALSVVRHRDNIGRLWAGTESKIGQRAEPAPAEPAEEGAAE